LDHGDETPLWTREILAARLKKGFGLAVVGSTVSQHLNRLGLSDQFPWFHPREQDVHQVPRFVFETFPRIQRLAHKLGAEMAFEDEAGVGLRTAAARRGAPSAIRRRS
jgi:hypothetical protein